MKPATANKGACSWPEMGSLCQALRWLGLVVLFVFAFGASADAASPFDLTYHGRMVDSTGKPISGPINIALDFYDASLGGNSKGASFSYSSVALIDGVFQVSINLGGAASNTVLDQSTETWIQITDQTNNKVYPRQSFFAVPYALKVPTDNTTIGFDSTGALSLKTGAINLVAGTSLRLGTFAANPSAMISSEQGKIWYNTTTGTLNFWNGSAAVALGATAWASPGAIGATTPNSAAFTTLTTTGNVGIGTTSPGAKLTVSGGQAVATFYSTASATIDWNNGNIQNTSVAAGAITLDSMIDGGVYTLILSDAGGGNYTFSATGVTFLCKPTCPATVTPGNSTVVTFLKAGSNAYVSWGGGYQ